MMMKSAIGVPTIQGHIFRLGTTAPHFWQKEAVVLIWLLHSLHATKAIHFLPCFGGD